MGKINRHYRTARIVLTWLLFLFVLPFSFDYGAFVVNAKSIATREGRNMQETRKIRVGFPDQSPLTMISENGELSGYTYDFLQEVAQYTGWEYEFVRLDGDINDVLSAMLTMLQKGELDLLGALSRNEALEKLYEYPENPSGMTYTTLCALEDNDLLTASNLVLIDDLKIASLKSSVSHLEELSRFCEANNIEPTLVMCDYEWQIMDKLHSGEADVFLNVDMNVVEDTKVVARFTPRPFYFAATKGNTGLVEELDQAISMMNHTDPYYISRLYETYFNQEIGMTVLNEGEQSYIQRAGTLRVAVAPYRAPIEYWDEETETFKGIGVDFLRYVSSCTGLQFEYFQVRTLEELKQVCQNNEADLVAGIDYDYGVAADYNLMLTRPFLTTQITMIVSNESDTLSDLTGKTLAMPRMLQYTNLDAGNTIWVDSAMQCLEAVSSKKADYAYGCGYSFQYYINQKSYPNISVVPQTSMPYRLCVGVTKPADENLLTLINKVVTTIPSSELQTIILRNTIHTPRNITLSSFIESNPWEALSILLIAAVFIIGLLSWYVVYHGRVSKRLKLENQRYMQLCDLSGEYLFEYDYTTDCFTQSPQCLEFLGGQLKFPRFFQWVQKQTDQPDSEKMQEASDQLNVFARLIRQGGSEEYCTRLKDGSSRWLRCTCKVIYDGANHPVYSLGKVADIQREREEKERLTSQAQRDSLTGVYNSATSRRFITERLEQMAVNRDYQGALFIFDVDYFKHINDHYGHYIGDAVLVAIGKMLQALFRKDDVIGRLGGDEFLAYIDHVPNTSMLEEKCRAMQTHLEKIDCGGGVVISITLSIGVALTTEEQDYDQLYQKADQALYQVKNKGRNGFHIV